MNKSQLKQIIREVIVSTNESVNTQDIVTLLSDATKSLSTITQKVNNISKTGKRPMARDVKPIEHEISNVVRVLWEASEKLKETYYAKRKPTPLTGYTDQGRDTEPTNGWSR